MPIPNINHELYSNCPTKDLIVGSRKTTVGWMNGDTTKTTMPPETKIEAGRVSAQASPQVEVGFSASPLLRTVHAVAAWYGTDPQGNLHLTFYTEQTPLPEKLVLKLNPDGTIISQNEIHGNFRFVKTAEVDISFTRDAAVEFYKSLGDNLKRINAI